MPPRRRPTSNPSRCWSRCTMASATGRSTPRRPARGDAARPRPAAGPPHRDDRADRRPARAQQPTTAAARTACSTDRVGTCLSNDFFVNLTDMSTAGSRPGATATTLSSARAERRSGRRRGSTWCSAPTPSCAPTPRWRHAQDDNREKFVRRRAAVVALVAHVQPAMPSPQSGRGARRAMSSGSAATTLSSARGERRHPRGVRSAGPMGKAKWRRRIIGGAVGGPAKTTAQIAQPAAQEGRQAAADPGDSGPVEGVGPSWRPAPRAAPSSE